MKKYQDFLPVQGIHDLTRTALAPRAPVSESEQESAPSISRRQSTRNKSRHRLTKKPSISDFEQGYAANIAPRYLTHSRRSLAQPSGSRIPGPIQSAALQSHETSRRPSPDKRSNIKGKDVKFSRPSSPNNVRQVSTSGKPVKQKISSRQKEKVPVRTSNHTPKSTLRRPITGPGSKVSNITKHFERLGRDAERSKSKYNIIRGKRARPVASARAKVEVLDSVKDAIRDDESESPDSSSEADDEGEGLEEEKGVPESVQSSPESDAIVMSPEASADSAPPTAPFSQLLDEGVTEIPGQDVPEPPPPEPLSVPPSPFLQSGKLVALTPPTSDVESGGGPERPSLLKALSGLWQQPPISRQSLVNDLIEDPEHIFRESSMVVRTDEPTSIIALALKYVPFANLVNDLSLIGKKVLPSIVRCLQDLVPKSEPQGKRSLMKVVKHSCLMIDRLRSRLPPGVL